MGSDTQFPERMTRISFASVLPSGPERPCLVVIAGAELGQTADLDRDQVVLGRDDDCGLVINSDLVSRHHATVVRIEGRHAVRDENSTNGTRHNRQWLQPEVEVELKAGDEIEIGEITLIRVLEAPEPHA